MAYQCVSPFMLNNEQIVSCGKCDPCRAKQTAHWQFRLMQEERRSLTAYFVTLTYAPEHLPLSPLGYATLEKTAVPAFVKRVRSFTSYADRQMKNINRVKVNGQKLMLIGK